MNSKLAKTFRREMRNAGKDPFEAVYNHDLPYISAPIVFNDTLGRSVIGRGNGPLRLERSCGKAIYRNIKRSWKRQ